MRRTKIVATVGPATAEPQRLEELIRAGVDVVRLNLSHGEIAEHLERIADVRRISDALRRPVGVLADLPGPKIRSGSFPAGSHVFEVGAVVRLTAASGPSTASRVTVDYALLAEDSTVGDRIVLGDGAIALRVTDIVDVKPNGDGGSEQEILAVVESGGVTQGRPGVHLRGDRLRLGSPTPEDLVLAETMAAAGVEFIAVSFVRTSADVDRVRQVVGDRAHLVAKIETAAALDDIEAIIESSDAVMVARGDLGIDCPLEDVPHLQKHIIRRCVEAGVPVITATQMLESMISAPSPTRAEVSDVANAVFDGTDAVMLSGETAIGHDPALVVRTMSLIAARAESEAAYRQWAERLGRVQRSLWGPDSDRITAALAHAASRAALDVEAAAILCCTRSGRTARAMARFRPEAMLFGISPDPFTLRRLTLTWGVEPMAMPECHSTDDMVWLAVEAVVHAGRVDHGATVVVLAGAADRIGTAATDVMRIVGVA
jgi:pyruvate kinase